MYWKFYEVEKLLKISPTQMTDSELTYCAFNLVFEELSKLPKLSNEYRKRFGVI